MSEPARILVCLRYGIGDLVMELPALDLLRSGFPQATITAMGADPAIELLEGDRRVDRVVSVQGFGFTHWGDRGTEEACDALERWLDAEAFDLIFDPSHAVLAVGEAIWQRNTALRDSGRELSVEALRAGAHGPEALRRAIAGGWGLWSEKPWVPSLPLQPLDPVLNEQFGSIPRPRVGIATVASSPLKRWAAGSFAQLMERLHRRHGAGFVLFTGPERLPTVIAEELSNLPAMQVGAMHLQQVASILAHCDVLVCNDTGVMHLAAAVGTRPVAVFGPTDPKLYLPEGGTAIGPAVPDCPVRLRETFGPPECVVHGACLNEVRSGRGCISEITVQQVERALGSVLDGGKPFASQ